LRKEIGVTEEAMRSGVPRRALLGAAAAGLASGACASNGAAAVAYRRISCEEAFTTPDIVAASRARAGGVASMRSGPIAGPIIPPLLDLGAARIADMDATGIDVQVLSLTSPGVQHLEAEQAVSLMRATNEYLAEQIRAHPTRYAGLAVMSTQAPALAAAELQRAVSGLGLRGAIINSHTNGEYLDQEKFWSILEAAEALDTPIYVHPREPSASLEGAMLPGFTVGWGYAVEVGTHVLRLIGAGIFERFPRLKIVIGHMGEMIPFVLDRIDNRYLFESGLFAQRRLPLAPSEYFKRNVWVTTSGMNYSAPLLATIAQLGVDRVLFAADYPLESQRDAVRQMEAMPLAAADKAKIFDANPTRVFGL
jgi:5-carboxyvanillate decarboxylase